VLKDTETRLALQAARGIAALQTLEKIKDAALEAVASRDEAKIRYDLRVGIADNIFVSTVIATINAHDDNIKSLQVDDDYYQDDDDE
jgi:hypothetical protein